MNFKNIPSSILFYYIGRLTILKDDDNKITDRFLFKQYGLPTKNSKIDSSLVEIGVDKNDIVKIKLKFLNMRNRESLFMYAIIK